MPRRHLTSLAVAQAYQAQYDAEPTLQAFHWSNAFIRGVRGPMGSGKSVGCVMEIMRRAHEQAPDRYKRRRSRWAAIRNTYGELKSTTIKTWQEWVPDEIAPIKWDSPISCRYIAKLDDGTTLDLEVLFVSCDRPADVSKLKSMDLTGLWLNEASELDKSVLDMAAGRHSRFPPKKDGSPYTWSGVIMDTNSMDDDHWWHHLAEGPDDPDEAAEVADFKAKLSEAIKEAMAVAGYVGPDRPLFEFFEQPPALIEAQGSYVPNPQAENVKNQPLGAAYWLQLAAGKTQQFIDIYILNKYGKVIDGKPVYNDEFNEAIHARACSLRPIAGLPIKIGFDFGLSPAAIPIQVSPKGQLLVLGECVALERSMGLEKFIGDALKPYLQNRFGSDDAAGNPWKFELVGDPSGNRRAESNETTAFQIAAALNMPIQPAKTNAFIARRESIAWFLNRLVGGEPAILIDNTARMIRKGFRGGYHYRRVQVSGSEARYQDEPYKNKYSHPMEALQYAAMEFVAIESPAYGTKAVPDWMRAINAKSGAVGKPWRSRGMNTGGHRGRFH
jgi:hypothetical protein